MNLELNGEYTKEELKEILALYIHRLNKNELVKAFNSLLEFHRVNLYGDKFNCKSSNGFNEVKWLINRNSWGNGFVQRKRIEIIKNQFKEMNKNELCDIINTAVIKLKVCK